MFILNEMNDEELKKTLLKAFSSTYDDEKKKERRSGVGKALTWMIRAAEKAKTYDASLIRNGYSSNPYGEIYEYLSDAIYDLIGEHTKRFEDSVTYVTLNADVLSEEHKLSLLVDEYKKNRPALV